MKDRLEKAFDFASDSTKQLITLSTGILTLTITFSKDILGGVSGDPINLLVAAWVVYLISIIFGLVTLLSLTGSLERGEGHNVGNGQPAESGGTGADPGDQSFPSIYASNIRIPATVQILLFLVATILIVVFAIQATAN